LEYPLTLFLTVFQMLPMPQVLQALPHIHAISAYQPGKPITALARELGLPVERIIKLASNENPLGASPRALDAVRQGMTGIERYPDPHALAAALAARHAVGTEQIVLGNGSNDILCLLAQVYLDTGRSAVYSQYAFAVYALATRSVGGEGIVTPARDYGHDLEAMRAAIRPDTALIWIANPNNPTGTFLSAAVLRDFLRAVPSSVIVVLDEAYGEYLAPEDVYDAVRWIAEFPNLVVCRTFSKIYGLAGLRVGYGVTSAPVADLMNRVRQPFNCNNLALVAAEAALDDADFIARSQAVNRQGMAEITTGFTQLGLRYLPSYGNFVSFRADDAVAVNKKLLREGVIVRPLASYDMREWLRVTIGTTAENERFLAALSKSLG
jgi:histidinol-phosphate aminotransferase